MKRTVKTDEGRKYPLVVREVIGEGSCPGEAHSNVYIDNCMQCAPKWGVVPIYRDVDVLAATKAGFAVMLIDVTHEEEDALKAAGLVKRVHVTMKAKSHTSSFYALVAV